jgi:hypothetical protein
MHASELTGSLVPPLRARQRFAKAAEDTNKVASGEKERMKKKKKEEKKIEENLPNRNDEERSSLFCARCLTKVKL